MSTNGYERITDALRENNYRELRCDGDWSLYGGPRDKMVVILKTKNGGYHMFPSATIFRCSTVRLAYLTLAWSICGCFIIASVN
jgi:hypothetical protein